MPKMTVVETEPVVEVVPVPVVEVVPVPVAEVVPVVEVVPVPVDNGKKQVDFLASIESKALIETIAPVMDNFDIENIMDVLPQIIAHVQHYKHLNGKQKKDMIVSMLKHLIDITDGPGNDEVWDPIIKRLIPSVVNTLVKVDQGKLKLNTKAPCFRLFSCCLPK
jgi:hypothetical protein